MGQPGNTPKTYQQRKESGVCTYEGCDEPAGDECLMCDPHRDRARARVKRSQTRIRRERKRKKECIYCGKRARAQRKTCAACVIRMGSTPTRLGNKDENRFDRIAARTVVDKDGRTRYRGRPRRGRLTVVSEIQQGLTDIERYLRKAVDGIAYVDSFEVKQLPRIQRDEARRAALSYVHLIHRIARDTLKVGGYEIELDVDEEIGGEEEIGEPQPAAAR